MTDQQRIQQLEYALQEQKASYALLYEKARKLIDAAKDYEKTPKSKEKLKQHKFYILKNCEKSLKETIYPQLKASTQAMIDWLGQ